VLERLSVALMCLITALAAPALAADYPNRAIRMVVPFAPGGGTDVLGRIIAQRLQEQWGQPVVVETSRAHPAASARKPSRALNRTDTHC
jgi:tripartite-type tricarboxylate transporter receptor subunit TctC